MPPRCSPLTSTLTADAETDDNIYQMMVPENSKGEIGDAITATDADPDVRLYTLGPTLGADGDPVATAVDHTLFTINARTGQISVDDDTTLNFEDPSDEDTNNTYELDIIATDPSGATGRATVNIVVTDADEAPVFAADAATELTIDEGSSTDEVTTPGDLEPAGSLDFAATDPDVGDTR